MAHRLRLALPPLASLTPQSPVAFAVFDRAGRLLRGGTEAVERLAQTAPARRVEVVLHPDDAIVADVHLPPLPARRLEAAVLARVEPMVLNDLDDLCVAHGPPDAEGRVSVVWTERHALLAAWRVLENAGLVVGAIVPLALALPAGDARPTHPLGEPVDARWQAALPNWSLAHPDWRPVRRTGRWRSALYWVGAALLLWLGGLHVYAARLQAEARTLQATMETEVRAAFPALTVVLDPLRQARTQVDSLRHGQGLVGHDDFLPLAQAAAGLLGFAAGHVNGLTYEAGRLTLMLAPGYVPPADEVALQRAAEAAALTVEKDGQTAHVWHVAPLKRPTAQGQP